MDREKPSTRRKKNNENRERETQTVKRSKDEEERVRRVWHDRKPRYCKGFLDGNWKLTSNSNILKINKYLH